MKLVTLTIHHDLPKYLAQQFKPYVNPNVVKMGESVLLSDACKQMIRSNSDEVIVVDKNDQLIGIVTDEDVIKKTSEAFVNPLSTTLGDIMKFPVAFINQNKNLADALNLMRQNKIRKLVVLSDENKIVGMLYKNTIINLIKKFLATNQQKQSQFWAIIWNLGIVLQFAGALMFVPAIISTILWETDSATGIYLMSTLLLMTGFFMNSYGKRQHLNLRGSAILIFSSFILLVLFGIIPQMLVIPFDETKPIEHIVISFFESSAGFTTGGLTLIQTPEDLPQGFTFYRSYTQFVGGLSFIYLIVTVFFPEHHLHSMRSFISGKIPQLRELFITITILFSIYITIIAVALYYLGERNLIDNFSLAMSALSTGGWIPHSQILVGLTIPEYIVIMCGMILGALPFGFHYAFVRTKFMSIQASKEVLVYFTILGIAIIIFVFSIDASLIDSIFNIISGSTSTGFQTISLTNLNPVAFSVIIIIMIIGGCGFSTAGGLKIYRLMTLAKIRELRKKQTSQLKKNEIISALILLAALPTIPFIVASYMNFQGYDFHDSYFDAISAITTTGLSAGSITSSMDPFLIIIFGVLPILGRIEIVLLVYMFVPKLIP